MSEKDMLKSIFELQRAIDEKVQIMQGFNTKNRMERVHRLLTFATGEIEEAQSKCGYVRGVRKHWQILIKPEFLEEMVDVLHFYISACIAADITPEQLFRAYVQKNLENHDRQKRGY